MTQTFVNSYQGGPEILYHRLLRDQYGPEKPIVPENIPKTEFEFDGTRAKFKNKENTFSTGRVVVKKAENGKPTEIAHGLIHKVDAWEPLDGVRMASDMTNLDYTFGLTDGLLAFRRGLADLAVQFRQKPDPTAAFRTQYSEFLADNPDLQEFVYIDRTMSSKNTVRPYLDELYKRVGKQATPLRRVMRPIRQMQQSEPPAMPAIPFVPPTQGNSDPPKEEKPEIPKQLGMFGMGLPEGLPMPGARRKTPMPDAPIPQISFVEKPKNNKPGILLPSGTRTKKGGKIKFDLKATEKRIIPTRKPHPDDFDYRKLKKPNDESDDPEHDAIMARYSGKFKDDKVATSHRGDDDLSTDPSRSPSPTRQSQASQPTQDPPMVPLADLDLSKASEPSKSEAPVIDSRLRNKIIEAIKRTQCTKEEYLEYKKGFMDLKNNFGKPIEVIKHGTGFFKSSDKRFINFMNQYQRFSWSKEGKDKLEKLFDVKDIVDLKTGKTTQNFERYTKANADLCLSVIMQDRTIDLEFLNKLTQKSFYYSMKFARRAIKRFAQGPDLYEALGDDYVEDLFDELAKEKIEAFKKQQKEIAKAQSPPKK